MKIDIDENLKSVNIYALYENGEFQHTKNLKDDWIMLIDIGRHLHTIMTNPRTTPDAIERYGLFWHRHTPEYSGTFLIIDDEWDVHQSVKPTEQDFECVKDGSFGGILSMENRCYMNRQGEFLIMNN